MSQKQARTHEQARKVVCVICFQKAIKTRPINTIYEQHIRSYLPDFEQSNIFYPSVLCNNCRIKIDKHLPLRPIDYTTKSTGESHKPCICDICDVARSNPHSYITSQSLSKKKPGRPRTSSPKKRLSVCSKCLGEVGKGISHDCTKRKKITNILKVTGPDKEQVASRILGDKTNQANASSAPHFLTLKRDRGVPLNVLVPNKKARLTLENPSKVDHQMLKKIQLENKENTSGMNKLVRTLRKGKVNYEWGSMTKLKKQTHDLDEYFDEIHTQLDTHTNQETALSSVVYCSDLNNLVSHLLKKRGISEDFLVKIGVDGGGGSLKV